MLLIFRWSYHPTSSLSTFSASFCIQVCRRCAECSIPGFFLVLAILLFYYLHPWERGHNLLLKRMMLMVHISNIIRSTSWQQHNITKRLIRWTNSRNTQIGAVTMIITITTHHIILLCHGQHMQLHPRLSLKLGSNPVNHNISNSLILNNDSLRVALNW